MATKSELITSVAERSGVTKTQADAVLAAFFDLTAETVKTGEKVSWPGFGAFSMSERAPRTGRNPQTGAPVKIGKSRSIKLSTSAPMKAWLLGKTKKR
ncbi:MAG: HU family DNA-binding protein [Acidimicrobiia bacterium]|nr:HU family DNA-binding protein [Acidimicrobiia bacterium]